MSRKLYLPVENKKVVNVIIAVVAIVAIGYLIHHKIKQKNDSDKDFF